MRVPVSILPTQYLLQAEHSPDYAKRKSMEMHQLHSEPKECGHCDIDYRLDAVLQGEKHLCHCR
jgi:hypothetical protein